MNIMSCLDGRIDMRNLFIPATLIAMTLSFGVLPNAAIAADRIDRQQDRLEDKIRFGERTGALTRVEANQLKARLDNIERREDRMDNNGLNFNERRMLSMRLDDLSRHVDRQISDNQRRMPNSRWNAHNRRFYTNTFPQTRIYSNSFTYASPPRWVMSKDGGYYDSTGQISGTVRGDQLFRFGGVMQNGSPAPSSPDVLMNAFGHIIAY